MPKEVDDVCQTVSIDDKRDGFAQDNNNHIFFKSHFRKSSQHTEEVCWTDRPNHHKDEKTFKTIVLVQPTDIPVVGVFADDRLDKSRTVGTR